jgi:chromosome segregation ATPase
MAAIIALAGKKIIAAKNAMFLLHTPLGAAMGNAKAFREYADNLDRYGESLMQSIIDRTKLSMEEVKEKWFDYEDHLMTAGEAKELGFFDEISDQEAKIDKEKNIEDIKNFFDTNEINNVVPFQSLCNSITTAINAFSENTAHGQSGQAANNNSQKNVINMKQFKKLNAALGVESLEAVDGFASFSEEQLEALETALGTDKTSEIKAQLDIANETIGQRDETIADLNSQLETANNTVAERDQTIENLNGEIADLKNDAADTGAKIHKSSDGNGKKDGAIAEKYDNPFYALEEVAQEYLGKSVK